MKASGAIQNAIQCYHVIYEKRKREKKEPLLRHQSWIIKKAKPWRIDAFELWCWRRLLRIPLTERRSTQSILKEISAEYSLEGLTLKLKLQYFGHLMQISDSFERHWCWERLKAGGEGDDRGWDDWMASPTQSTWGWASSESWWWTGTLGQLVWCSPWGCRESNTTERLNWSWHLRASLVAQW